MSNIPILSRQQRREVGREVAMDMGKFVETVDRNFSMLNYRINILFETLKATGVTEEMLTKAVESVNEQMKLASAQANDKAQ